MDQDSVDITEQQPACYRCHASKLRCRRAPGQVSCMRCVQAQEECCPRPSRRRKQSRTPAKPGQQPGGRNEVTTSTSLPNSDGTVRLQNAEYGAKNITGTHTDTSFPEPSPMPMVDSNLLPSWPSPNISFDSLFGDDPLQDLNYPLPFQEINVPDGVPTVFLPGSNMFQGATTNGSGTSGPSPLTIPSTNEAITSSPMRNETPEIPDKPQHHSEQHDIIHYADKLTSLHHQLLDHRRASSRTLQYFVAGQRDQECCQSDGDRSSYDSILPNSFHIEDTLRLTIELQYVLRELQIRCHPISAGPNQPASRSSLFQDPGTFLLILPCMLGLTSIFHDLYDCMQQIKGCAAYQAYLTLLFPPIQLGSLHLGEDGAELQAVTALNAFQALIAKVFDIFENMVGSRLSSESGTQLAGLDGILQASSQAAVAERTLVLDEFRRLRETL
ncbi:hypothetical protein GGR56DRAFT_317942 [Xylariaceae sp. FL0804]|nr:hypothetical protein GGR56DRAFT_317942 [Xylariaceae sp. FL0804]